MSTQTPENLSGQSSPAPNPEGLFRYLSDWVAVVGAFFLSLLAGMTWGTHRANQGIYFYLAGEETRPRDIPRFIYTTGLAPFVLLGILAIIAWRVSRRGSEPSMIKAFASLCRCLWPLSFCLLVLPSPFYFMDRDFFLYLFAGPMGLAAAMVALRTARYFPPQVERLEAWVAKKMEAFRTPGVFWGTLSGIFILAYIGWFSYLPIMRYLSFGALMHDLGTYDQLMWNTINGRWFEAGIFRCEIIGYEIHKYDNHFFAEHFIPTFWLVTPFYWLFPSMKTVIVAQTVFIAAAAIPIYLIALRKLASPALGCLFVFAYLAHPVVQQANMQEVHVDTFAPVFLLGAFAAYLYGHRVLYWVLLLFALGCKEEFSVNVAALGLFLFFGEKDRRTGAATAALGVFWFFLTTALIIPYFRSWEPVRQLDRYSAFLVEGQYDPNEPITMGMLAKSMLLNPVHTIETIVTYDRIRSMFFLLAPFGMLMLWGRWAWLWLLPPLAVHLLSGTSVQYTLWGYYGIVAMPAVAVGSIYGAQYLLARDIKPGCTLPFKRQIALFALIAMTVYPIWTTRNFTPGGGRYKLRHYRIEDHNRLAHEFLSLIPDDAIVSAQAELGAHLTQRRFIYNFPTTADAEYIILDTRGSTWPLLEENAHHWHTAAYFVLRSEEWGLIRPYEDGFLLFKRGHPTDLNEEVEELDFSPYRRDRY